MRIFSPPIAAVLVLVVFSLRTASAQEERPKPTLANAEKLETIASLAAHGQLGCGAGTFQYIDHSGNKRAIKSGLDPIHVFGNEISATTISTFLKGRAKANEIQKGPMHGQRRFLMYVVLSVVSDTKDTEHVKDLLPLLKDPMPEIRRNAEWALISIGDAHPNQRETIRNAFKAVQWKPESSPSQARDWLPTGH